MKIDANDKNIRALLTNTRYRLDYYQREYSWQTKHVSELIDDLTNKFLEFYKEEHERSEVHNYGHYFLGSIIISHSPEDGQRYIVDGQQRLTTLTLLLIRLRHLLKDENEKMHITPLIYSQVFGTKGLNIDVPTRMKVMKSLYDSGALLEENVLEPIDQPESIYNIANRYIDIENLLSIGKEKLPYFVDWLLERVFLVEITAYADDEAYTIFETMNDRGLSLSPADMLRGYLLSNIKDIETRDIASQIWSERVQGLKQFGTEDESDAIKAWLRSQYAEENKDFDRIGSEFHRWVRDKEDVLSLNSAENFAGFIQNDFFFYSSWYLHLLNATKELIPDLKCVFYNAQHNFTLQYPVLLAPLCLNDPKDEIKRKIQLVSTYLDIFLFRRIWNSSSIAQRDLTTTMFSLMSDIRGKGVKELSDILYEKLNENPFVLQGSPDQPSLFDDWEMDSEITLFNTYQFRLHSGNSKSVRLILARMTDYVEVRSGQPSRYLEYVRTGKNSYEIEHIWSNHHERHHDEFAHRIDFQNYRNCIGGLLLLPKAVNAGIGDKSFAEKLPTYIGQNLLAQSLHETVYEKGKGFSGFQKFIERSQLPFRPHPEFKKDDLDARQALYTKLAEQIWSPERLLEDAS